MTGYFHAQIDLRRLAESLAPYLADHAGSGPASRPDEESSWNTTDWPDEDPWSSGQQVREDRPEKRSGPSAPDSGAGNRSRSNASPAARNEDNGPRRRPEQSVDKFGREWTFGERDAPDCSCQPAARAGRVEGTSQAGNDYNAWACAKGFGEDYRDRCNFWEYV